MYKEYKVPMKWPIKINDEKINPFFSFPGYFLCLLFTSSRAKCPIRSLSWHECIALDQILQKTHFLLKKKIYVTDERNYPMIGVI